MGLNAEHSKKTFGRETRFNPRPLVTAITVTPQQIWLANPDRLMLMIMNTGAAEIRVSDSPTVTDVTGISLAAGGGVMALNVESDGEMVSREWWARTTAGVSVIYSAEVVGV